MIQREDIRKMKTQRHAIFAALLFACAMLLVAVLLVWKGQITGFHSLETFEYAPHVTGSSPDGALYFEELPDFRAVAGKKVLLRVEPNSGEVIFSDDTHLFNITQEGIIEFTAQDTDAGHHRVIIFIKNRNSQFYFQDIHIIIEE